MSTSTSPPVSTSRGLLRRMEEGAKTSKRQGIGSILGSERERPKTAASLRRTVSADMSSKKWLKIPSSESFPVPSDSSSSSSSSLSPSPEGEEDEEQVLKRTKKTEDLERPGLSDIWGSILSQKTESKSSSAPYIHPLVKRSKSSLSQKSLEICTESLGSESSSEGFSSYQPSETGDFEDKSTEEQQSTKETEELPSQAATLVKEKEELEADANYNYFAATSKSPARSFPPPLPSLSQRAGPCFLMQSHRREGRLVLEAVHVSSYNYFHAERQGGCLRLSFTNKASAELRETDGEEEELELEDEEEAGEEVQADVFDEFQGFEEEEETEKVERENNGVQVRGIVTEVSQPTLMVPCEVINVHGSTSLLTNKVVGMTNKNLVVVEEEEEEEEEAEEELTQLPQSLPCPPRVARLMPLPATPAAAAAASFNAYDYFWRTKPAAAAMHPLTQQQPPPPPPISDNNNYYSYCYPNKHKNISCSNKMVISNSKMGLNPQEQLNQTVVLRGNEAEFLVPPMKGGCKEPRSRSLFIWHPTRCIATS